MMIAEQFRCHWHLPASQDHSERRPRLSDATDRKRFNERRVGANKNGTISDRAI
jgi:hypothetical protein